MLDFFCNLQMSAQEIKRPVLQNSGWNFEVGSEIFKSAIDIDNSDAWKFCWDFYTIVVLM